MIDGIDTILQEAATVQQLGIALLESVEALNENQQNTIEKIVEAAEYFSSLVPEMMDFLESGSHEILTASFEMRAPIAAMQGFAEMLLMGITGPLTPFQTEYLIFIEEAAQKLGALVDELFNNAAPW